MDRQKVSVSAPCASAPGLDAQRDRGIEDPRAVDVDLESEGARSLDQLIQLVHAEDGPARVVVGVFDGQQRRAREMDVVGSNRAGHLLG